MSISTGLILKQQQQQQLLSAKQLQSLDILACTNQELDYLLSQAK